MLQTVIFCFDASYHFHPEFELTLILKSERKCFTSNQMANFKGEDLVLLGANVPHCWKSEGIENKILPVQS